MKGAWAVAKFRADIMVTNKRLNKASKLLERVQTGTGDVEAFICFHAIQKY